MHTPINFIQVIISNIRLLYFVIYLLKLINILDWENNDKLKYSGTHQPIPEKNTLAILLKLLVYSHSLIIHNNKFLNLFLLRNFF